MYFRQFYKSDMIIPASSLVLRMTLVMSAKTKRNYDFLSRIELMVDQADAMHCLCKIGIT